MLLLLLLLLSSLQDFNDDLVIVRSVSGFISDMEKDLVT